MMTAVKAMIFSSLLVAAASAVSGCAGANRAYAWNDVTCPPGYEKLSAKVPGATGVCQHL